MSRFIGCGSPLTNSEDALPDRVPLDNDVHIEGLGVPLAAETRGLGTKLSPNHAKFEWVVLTRTFIPQALAEVDMSRGDENIAAFCCPSGLRHALPSPLIRRSLLCFLQQYKTHPRSNQNYQSKPNCSSPCIQWFFSPPTPIVAVRD